MPNKVVKTEGMVVPEIMLMVDLLINNLHILKFNDIPCFSGISYK